jgi:hypothetical protein
MSHVIGYLQDLHTVWTFAIVCLTMMILVVAMPLLRARVLRLTVSRATNDGASDAFKAVAGFMVFVVGFSLVQVQGQFRTTEDLALKEANHVYSLDRSLFHFGTPASLAARLDLQEYVKSVIEDEWALLAHSKRSPKTDALYKKLNADIRLLEGETGRQRAAEAQMLRSLDDMGDLREARIAAADFGLLPLYWWVMAALFAILLFLAFLSADTADKMIANCGLICAVSILLTLVLIYEDPFSGDIIVSPSALKRVLALMMER